MNIITRHQIECDICGDTDEREVSLEKSKEVWKLYGWKMGKETMCPQCQGVYSDKKRTTNTGDKE